MSLGTKIRGTPEIKSFISFLYKGQNLLSEVAYLVNYRNLSYRKTRTQRNAVYLLIHCNEWNTVTTVCILSLGNMLGRNLSNSLAAVERDRAKPFTKRRYMQGCI